MKVLLVGIGVCAEVRAAETAALQLGHGVQSKCRLQELCTCAKVYRLNRVSLTSHQSRIASRHELRCSVG